MLRKINIHSHVNSNIIIIFQFWLPIGQLHRIQLSRACYGLITREASSVFFSLLKPCFYVFLDETQTGVLVSIFKELAFKYLLTKHDLLGKGKTSISFSCCQVLGIYFHVLLIGERNATCCPL